MKILIVEDDTAKLRNIVSVLQEIDGVELDNIVHQVDANGAKRFLRDGFVDVIILDLHLPDRVDLPPNVSGGLDFLTSLVNRPAFFVPSHVIAVSGNPEASLNVHKEGDVWGVIKYDSTDAKWREQLKNRIRYIQASIRSRQSREPDHPPHDVAVITALDEELAAILALPLDWSDYEVKDDATRYRMAILPVDRGALRIVTATASRMGMAASASLSMKIINTFRPRYLIMSGVTGGIRGRTELGDILVADPSWDWGSGKYEIVDETPNFSPNPEQLRINPDVRSDLIQASVDEATLAQIKASFGGNRPSHDLKCHVAAVATGAAVLSDEAVLSSIKSQNRKIHGVEMEVYGMMMAADTCSRPRPLAFAAKSVSDFADPAKDDSARSYALHSSANFVLNFMRKYVRPHG